MPEVFVVKNKSGAPLDIKDFGFGQIPDNESVDLGDLFKAKRSTEVNGLLDSGDLVRVMNGVEVPYSRAFCCEGIHDILVDSNGQLLITNDGNLLYSG